MAVVQISKIQIRRGQKNTSSGLPQLASGELAWAIDTQEVYIGNGAVSEGAPYVGNTKILTERDNLLELVGTYQFAKNIPYIQTGPNANQPVARNLQDVIDQFITLDNFATDEDIQSRDYTNTLQRAIYQLNLNEATVGPPQDPGTITEARVELMVGPGLHILTETIYLPSYVFITGAGKGKTIFRYDGEGTAFQFINSNSTMGEPTTANTTQINQPKYVYLRDFTVLCSSALANGIEFNSVCDSRFQNIEIIGAFPVDDSAYTESSYGMVLRSSSYNNPAAIDAGTNRNVFENITVSNFANGIISDDDIQYNKFNNCEFTNLYYGVVFGKNTTGGPGQVNGPIRNNISNSLFKYINRQGILIGSETNLRCYGNSSANNKFENVGNDGGETLTNMYSIIKFVSPGNSSFQDSFDRARVLAINEFEPNYLPEVEGAVSFVNSETQITPMGPATQALPIIRIPLGDSTGFEVSYIYKSNTNPQFRKGKMTGAVDLASSNITFVDDFETTGIDPGEIGPGRLSEQIDFTAEIVDNTVVISYTNQNDPDSATLTYTTSALS